MDFIIAHPQRAFGDRLNTRIWNEIIYNLASKRFVDFRRLRGVPGLGVILNQKLKRLSVAGTSNMIQAPLFGFVCLFVNFQEGFRNGTDEIGKRRLSQVWRFKFSYVVEKLARVRKGVVSNKEATAIWIRAQMHCVQFVVCGTKRRSLCVDLYKHITNGARLRNVNLSLLLDVVRVGKLNHNS